MTAGDSVAGSVGSPVSAGTATWADIASLAPAAIAARNGDELAGLEPLARRRGRRRARGACPGRRVAETREVLDRGGHAGRLQPADHRRPEPPDAPPGRRRTSGSRAPAFAGLGREVEDRGVDDVDAHRPRLEPDRRADPLGEVLVADRAERHVAGERPSAPSPSAMSWPRLLVGADQQQPAAAPRRGRLGRPLERLGQLADLPGRRGR